MKFLTEKGTDFLRQMSFHIQTVMETEACLLTDRSFFIHRQKLNDSHSSNISVQIQSFAYILNVVYTDKALL